MARWQEGKTIKGEGRGRKRNPDDPDPEVKSIIRIEKAKDKATRSERAINMDAKQTNKVILDPAKAEDRERWEKRKGASDLAGVDAPYADLRMINKDAADKLQAKADEVEAITKDKTLPLSFKVERVEKLKEETKAIIEETKQEIAEAHRAGGKKWSAERKKEADEVRKQLGINSLIQADALIQRAKRQGIEYDQVDWDALQGTDLAFGDQVERLNGQVGTTETLSELEGEITTQMDRYEEAYDDYMEKVKAANFEFGAENDTRSIKKIISDMKKDAPIMTDSPEVWQQEGADRSDLIGWDDKEKTEAKEEWKADAKVHKNPGIEETTGQFRYRIEDPDQFEIMRTKYPGDDPSSGISFIVGREDQADPTTEVQAIRFDKDRGWTKKKVEKWIKGHQAEIARMKDQD